MRRTTGALLGLALSVCPALLLGQQAFEGVLTYRMTAEGTTLSMTQSIKGPRVRIDMEVPGMPGPMYMLMDTEKMVMQTVMTSMGMYMEVDMNQAMQMVPEEQRRAAESAQLEALGTSDEIAGISCRNYRFTTGDEQAEGCIATGLGHFMGMGGGGGPSNPLARMGPDLSAFAKEFEDGMVPLRLRVLRNGTWETVMEATAVERKRLEDSVFQLPAGLRKMNMPGGDGER
jgi:hypothetical protein